MKSLNMKRLAVIALTLAALCASSMWAAGTGAQTTGNHKFYSLPVVTGAEGYDLQWTDGRVVGLRALRPDGRWFDLRPQTPPDDGTGLPDMCPGLDQGVYCYEDEELQMTVCICVPFATLSANPGEAIGPVIDSWKFVKRTSR